MSRVEPLQPASINIYPLSSLASRQALSVFVHLLSLCAGPHGKNHLVRNAVGGHMTITSTCSRLLSSISISRSELKLVSSAISGHLLQHEDCGLFMAHMCMQLTKLSLDLDIHHNLVSSAFQAFVSIIVDYIKSDNCNVSIKADFSNVDILLAYVQSIFTSKTLLNVQLKELNSCSLTVLNAFVRAIPSVPYRRYSSGVFVLGLEKQPIKNSKIVNGIMLECPELPLFGDIQELKIKMGPKIDGSEHLKVALITCSMSGDMEEAVTATYEATEQQFDDMEECVIEKMTILCDAMERENVAIVLCQKVIHPRIKTILRSKGIIFLDRLGSQPIPFIRDLAGCKPVTSVLQNIRDGDCIGKLTSVTPCNENGKSFVCLENNNSSVVTLQVCAEFEERLSELKCCVNTCLKGLESLVKEPRLLMGGGCWQMHCSQILKEKVLSSLEEMSKKLLCTKATVRQLLTVFRTCLHQWCMILKDKREHVSYDRSSFHSWKVNFDTPLSFSYENINRCGCGFKSMPVENVSDLDIMLTQNDGLIMSERKDLPYIKDIDGYDGVVLDNFTACVDALHKGVLTTGLLLSIGQFICDKN